MERSSALKNRSSEESTEYSRIYDFYMVERDVYNEYYYICSNMGTRLTYNNDHDFEFISSASRCACFKSLSVLILASSSRTPCWSLGIR